MRGFIKILLAIVVLAAAAGFFALRTSDKPRETEVTTPAPIIQEPSEEVDFTASFEIYTEGTKRIFTNAMYHNLSKDAFIQSPDPSIITVKKEGVTWTDFFGTLPFSLDKECLTTGTGQTFCNTESQKLRFTLNGEDTPDALDLEIMPGDRLVVEYY